MTKFIRFAEDKFILVIPAYRRATILNDIINCLDDYNPVFANVQLNCRELKAAIKPKQNKNLHIVLQQRERLRNLLGETAFEISATGLLKDFFEGESILEQIIERLRFGIISFDLPEYQRVQTGEDLLRAYRRKSLEIDGYVKLFQHDARQTYYHKDPQKRL